MSFDPTRAGILAEMNVRIVDDPDEMRRRETTKPFLRLSTVAGGHICDMTLNVAELVVVAAKEAKQHRAASPKLRRGLN